MDSTDSTCAKALTTGREDCEDGINVVVLETGELMPGAEDLESLVYAKRGEEMAILGDRATGEEEVVKRGLGLIRPTTFEGCSSGSECSEACKG
jgi:hypothetical protein